MVNARMDGYEAGRRRISGQMHWFSWYRESVLDFGTDGHPFEILPEGLLNVRVNDESGIITDFFTKQSRAYSNPYLLHHFHIYTI